MENAYDLSPIESFGDAQSSRPCAPAAVILNRISPADPLIALQPARAGEPYVVTPQSAQIDDAAQFIIEVDLPGVSEKEVQVRITDTLISVEGPRPGSKSLTTKITPQVYKAVIHVPPGGDGEKTKASLKNGVLELVIPKLPATRKEGPGRLLKVD